MPYEIHELTDFDRTLLSRSYAFTVAHIEMAQDIAHHTLGIPRPEVTSEMVASISQILATNYLAAVTRNAG